MTTGMSTVMRKALPCTVHHEAEAARPAQEGLPVTSVSAGRLLEQEQEQEADEKHGGDPWCLRSFVSLDQ